MKIYKILCIGLLLAFSACSNKIPDVISQFQNGINANDVTKVAGTISASATDYDSLANNNWSGLATQISNWQLQGTYAFSGLTETVIGELADVNCTAAIGGVDHNCYFLMINDSGSTFKTWKIKKWVLTFGTNQNIYLQKIVH